MMKSVLFLIACFFSIAVPAQYKVTFKVTPPAKHLAEPFFIAGSFNTWNPYDTAHTFKADQSGVPTFTAQLSPGSYEYKFTRGGWNKVETTADGKDVGNRSFRLQSDTTIVITIGGWRDDFKQETIVRKHTASAHVIILDSAFGIPQLNRTRRIWLYLPADYATSKKKISCLVHARWTKSF